ncbi:MAG TPA: GDP-mannose 4,6-dehydratase [Cytophagaceae bacterium]|jgi:GDPmannose 4,6-dehydratase|nr:GDP-mannose 4,6-dehydratase [Cytophagaceae bacterium]
MKKAIVTGITGQDGAYLAKLLLEKGYQVIGTTRAAVQKENINLQYLGIADKVILLETDLLNKVAIIELLEEYQPDEFYHLAGQSSVGASFNYPIETMHFNSLSVVNILEAIRNLNAPVRFYQASSSEMFGNMKEENLPIKETLLFHPTSPYGISKVAAHWTAVNYREAYSIFSACGILFNHESCLRGKDYVTKKIIMTALKISKGEATELLVGNTNIYRDWGYAPKYIEAMWLILQQDEPSDYLICSGDYMSLKVFIEKVFSQLDLDYKKYLKVNPSLKRKSDLPIIYGNNTKAKKHLNWDYNMSIDELITQLIADEIAFSSWQKERQLQY